MKDKGKLWQYEEVLELSKKLRSRLPGGSYWIETPPNAFRKGRVVIHLPDYRKWHWVRMLAAKVLRKRLMTEFPSEVVVEIKTCKW